MCKANEYKHSSGYRVYDNWIYDSTCVGGDNLTMSCMCNIPHDLRGRRNSTIKRPRSGHNGSRSMHSVNTDVLEVFFMHKYIEN